jgi:hypothetical protein
MLNISGNSIHGRVGAATVLTLACRCTNLDRLELDTDFLSPDRQSRVDLLPLPKPVLAAQIFQSCFSVLFLSFFKMTAMVIFAQPITVQWN